MTKVSHDCSCAENPLVPSACRVIDIVRETPDIKTFRVQTTDGKRPFEAAPGRLGMLSLFGVGEAMFSVSASGEDWLDFSIKRTGELTEALHEISKDTPVGLRGPYGNGFPVEELKGFDLLFIGGGIALAPLRPLIRHAFEKREDFGHIDILYGARSMEDLVFKTELFETWPFKPDTGVFLTVDVGSDDWKGNVGFVPTYLEQLAFKPEGKKVILCGPPIMIKFCSEALARMGFKPEDIVTTLEMRMKCGVGKCGRCNIGSKFVCLDGPVFTLSELEELPDEK